MGSDDQSQILGELAGPLGFSATAKRMEVRPGGIWKIARHGPDGANYPNESIFNEVVNPERVVFGHGRKR
jgi:uncharacterized protein YndB with AHSA1/START domain